MRRQWVKCVRPPKLHSSEGGPLHAFFETKLKSRLVIMKRLITIVLLLYSLNITAEKGVIDSLTTELKNDLHDTVRANHLNELAWELMNVNSDTALILSSEALKISELNEWKSGIARSSSMLGIFNDIVGNYSSALQFNFNALKISISLFLSSTKISFSFTPDSV